MVGQRGGGAERGGELGKTAVLQPKQRGAAKGAAAFGNELMDEDAPIVLDRLGDGEKQGVGNGRLQIPLMGRGELVISFPRLGEEIKTAESGQQLMFPAGDGGLLFWEKPLIELIELMGEFARVGIVQAVHHGLDDGVGVADERRQA